MTPLDHYRKLETRLSAIRALEELVLTEMDKTWWAMTDNEHTLLKSEPPHCWPEDGPVSDEMAFARMRQFVEEEEHKRNSIKTWGVCD